MQPAHTTTFERVRQMTAVVQVLGILPSRFTGMDVGPAAREVIG